MPPSPWRWRECRCRNRLLIRSIAVAIKPPNTFPFSLLHRAVRTRRPSVQGCVTKRTEAEIRMGKSRLPQQIWCTDSQRAVCSSDVFRVRRYGVARSSSTNPETGDLIDGEIALEQGEAHAPPPASSFALNIRFLPELDAIERQSCSAGTPGHVAQAASASGLIRRSRERRATS